MAKMLRNTFFSETLYNHKLQELKESETQFQNSCDILCAKLHVKFDTPDDVDKMTVENLKAEMDAILDNERGKYDGRMFCDEDYLHGLEERHNQLMLEYTPFVESVQSQLARIKKTGCRIKVDSKGRVWVDEQSMKSAATALATVTWSDEDKALYTKLGELADLLVELTAIQQINYNYLLKFVIPDRETDGTSLLGKVRGMSITPEKYLALKNCFFGMLADGFFINPNDVIL